jgi:hypothetical protein
MSKDAPQTKKNLKPSALTLFDLSFEYDVTWTDIRKSVKNRSL